MRILFLAPRFPFPALRGDQRRVLDLLRVLREHAEITLLSFGTPADPPLPFEDIRVRTVRRGPLGLLAANLTRPDPRLPLQVRLYLDRAMARACAEELAREPDVVHVTLARMGPYLPPPGRAHRHLDLVDSLAVNMRTRADASRRPVRAALRAEAGLLERYEARLAAAADSVSLVAEADRVAAAGLERAVVIPNGVDLGAFAFAPPLERPNVLLYFGNLGYFHAVEPARRVATEILPLVRREVPGVVLRLAGARPAPAVQALAGLPGVELIGPVERMADALHGAAVAVVPAYTGSGIKNKVLEAYAAGTPVVTNAFGVAGVAGARAGEDHLLGESSEAIAAACVALLRDPDARMRQAVAARALVERSYSWERQGERLMELYAGGRPE
ncbi:MAG TPA: glycosyltransferase family 4 protein [Candidatus Elarobacter sp.]